MKVVTIISDILMYTKYKMIQITKNCKESFSEYLNQFDPSSRTASTAGSLGMDSALDHLIPEGMDRKLDFKSIQFLLRCCKNYIIKTLMSPEIQKCVAVAAYRARFEEYDDLMEGLERERIREEEMLDGSLSGMNDSEGKFQIGDNNDVMSVTGIVDTRGDTALDPMIIKNIIYKLLALLA